MSKIFRGNLISLSISTVLISSGSILDLIKGKISSSQLFKNLGKTGGTVGGGYLGSVIGTAILPGAGTIIGGLLGSGLGGKAAKKTLDTFIDDAIHSMEVLKDTFMENIEELQLDRDELNYIVDYIFDPEALPQQLKEIYSAENPIEYIEEWMDPYINAILKTRPRISDLFEMVNYDSHILKV